MPCINPFQIKTGEKVPCGKCTDCKKRRVSGWSFRLVNEGRRSTSAHFITLTYDTKHVPITDYGYMGLEKRDLQLFFKRLRKAHPENVQIKYYACGEYGGKTNRPHYHIILFNADIKLIQPAWQLGQVHYGDVNGASIGYTLKYICKESKIPMHKNDDRLKEFAVMSKGLGTNYLTPAMIRWHKADLDRMYLNLPDGRKVAMPRYYKLKIYSDDERKKVSDFILPRILLEAEKSYLADLDYFGDHQKIKEAKHQQIIADKEKLRQAEKQRNKI